MRWRRLCAVFRRCEPERVDKIVLINLSGRGDKDVNQVAKLLGVKLF